MMIFLTILIILVALQLLMSATVFTALSHILGMPKISFKRVLMIVFVMVAASLFLGTVMHLLFGSQLITSLASIAASLLVFEYLFDKERQVSEWRKFGLYISYSVTVTLLGFLLILSINGYLFMSFLMAGDSMSPYLEGGDYLIVERLSGGLERGDVVLFMYPKDNSKLFLKRIIGLPGERISFPNGKMTISAVDGAKIEMSDDYMIPGMKGEEIQEVILGSKEYFLVGDNPSRSSDSRNWGPVEEREIIGKLWFRAFSVK